MSAKGRASSILILLALAGCAGEVRQSVGAYPAAARSRLLLNGVWEFAVAPDGQAPAQGWTRLRVPHRSWEFEDQPPTSGWYRTALSVPEDWQAGGSDIVLYLSRVRHYARVYVGDKVVGEHWGMRTPFRISLAGKVEPGKTYPLFVYTHNCEGKYAHPSGKELSENGRRALDTLFWYTGASTIGVEGDVWLQLEPRLRVEQVYVITSVRRKEVTVEVTVRNETDAEARCRLELCVARDGRRELDLPEQAVSVAAGGRQVVKLTAVWENPVVWGRPPFGQPVLYSLRAVLWDDAKVHVADARVQRFGFREVWTEGDKLLLNGQPLFTWGDHSVPYVHERQWLTRKLPDLAACNVSTVEHHRYDAPPVLYDVADELGAFIVSSNFCVGTGQVPMGLPPEELELVLADHLNVADYWVQRDRNHPSILFWDVTDTWEPVYCVPLMKRVKEFDASRIVEVTYRDSPPEMLALMDTYRLFSSLEHIEKTIEAIHSSPTLPVKPIRVGEAGIFSEYKWDFDRPPPIGEQWVKFIESMPARHIWGLHTFSLTDMDYRGFTLAITGSLSKPLNPKVTWPSQSGTDARIDPFGEGTPQARGKAALYLNWCDPALPVSVPTPTRAWWRKMFKRLTGRDVGPLAQTRVPEAIVTVNHGDQAVPGACVFVTPLEGQGMEPYGVKADDQGRSWFVLAEEGLYRFTCRTGAGRGSVDVQCRRHKIDVRPGYDHIQWVSLEVTGEGPGQVELAAGAAGIPAR